MYVFVCVCVCEREREREREILHIYIDIDICICVYICLHNREFVERKALKEHFVRVMRASLVANDRVHLRALCRHARWLRCVCVCVCARARARACVHIHMHTLAA